MSKGIYGAPTTGRRNCTRCKLWRHAIDFRCRKRDKETGEALILDYQCNSCHRAKERIRGEGVKPKTRKRRKSYKRAWRRQRRLDVTGIGRHPQSQPLTGRRGSVSRIPIAKLLYGKLQYMTMMELARILEVNEKRLYGVIFGYTRVQVRYNGSPSERTRLASVDYIEITTVDRWLIRLGEPADALERLYPADSRDVA